MTIARSVVILLLGVSMFMVAHFLPKGESDLLLWYQLQPGDIAKVSIFRPNHTFTLINKSPENYSFDNWSYRRDNVIDDNVSRSFESFLSRLLELKIGERISEIAAPEYEINDDGRLVVNYEIDSKVEVKFGALSPYFKTLRYASVSRNGERLGVYLIDDSFYQMVIGKENTFREKYRIKTDVKELELVRGKDSLKLLKNGNWQAIDYVDYPISQEYIAEYLRVIRSISVGEFLDAPPAELGESEFQIKLGDKIINFYAKEDLIFSIDTKFYKAESNVLGRLTVPFTNFLRKTIVDPVEFGLVESIAVQIGEDRYKVSKNGGNWEFDEDLLLEGSFPVTSGEHDEKDKDAVESSVSRDSADGKFIEQYLQDLANAECDHTIEGFKVAESKYFNVKIKIKDNEEPIEISGDLGEADLVKAKVGDLSCVMTPSGKIQLFPLKEKFTLLVEDTSSGVTSDKEI